MSPHVQNRAYAVSQLNDLAAKLVKGQQTAQTRRNNPDGLTLPKKGAMDDVIPRTSGTGMVMSTPNASPAKPLTGAKGKDKAPVSSGKGPAQEDGKAREDTALLKAVKDRLFFHSLRRVHDLKYVFTVTARRSLQRLSMA